MSQELAESVDALTAQTTALLQEYVEGNTTLQNKAIEATDAAASALASQQSAASDAATATTKADEAEQHANNAAAVVTGGTATLTPEAGKIPLADANGKIDIEWLKLDALAKLEPDVYIPFNDSLQIVRGYGKHDQIDVSAAQDGSVMVELPSKSVDFSRSSNRTYFNKSGEVVTAAIDEPRFSRNGLIIEKSVTNFIGQVKAQANGVNTTYSDSAVPFLDTTFSIYTIDNVAGESYKDLQQVTANNFNDGEVWTFSVFFNLAETTTDSISLRLAYGMSGTVKYNIATNALTQGSFLGSFERYGNILRLSITDTYSTHANGVLCRVQAYDREVGDTFSMCGGQLEKGAVASSYIKPSGSVVTAASDLVTLPIRNNIPAVGRSFTISFECHTGYEQTESTFEQIITIGNNQNYIGIERNNSSGFRVSHSLWSWFNATAELGRWSGIDLVYDTDGTDSKISLYQDGNLLASNTYSDAVLTLDYDGLIRIGASRLGNVTLNGGVKEVSITHRALTEIEIAVRRGKE